MAEHRAGTTLFGGDLTGTNMIERVPHRPGRPACRPPLARHRRGRSLAATLGCHSAAASGPVSLPGWPGREQEDGCGDAGRGDAGRYQAAASEAVRERGDRGVAETVRQPCLPGLADLLRGGRGAPD